MTIRNKPKRRTTITPAMLEILAKGTSAAGTGSRWRERCWGRFGIRVKSGHTGRSVSENLRKPMCWVCRPYWRRGSNSHCVFGDLHPCPEMVSPMEREKLHIFNVIAAESDRPEMMSFPGTRRVSPCLRL